MIKNLQIWSKPYNFWSKPYEFSSKLRKLRSKAYNFWSKPHKFSLKLYKIRSKPYNFSSKLRKLWSKLHKLSSNSHALQSHVLYLILKTLLSSSCTSHHDITWFMSFHLFFHFSLQIFFCVLANIVLHRMFCSWCSWEREFVTLKSTSISNRSLNSNQSIRCCTRNTSIEIDWNLFSDHTVADSSHRRSCRMKISLKGFFLFSKAFFPSGAFNFNPNEARKHRN